MKRKEKKSSPPSSILTIMGPCDRGKEGVCAKEGEDVPIVEREKRRG